MTPSVFSPPRRRADASSPDGRRSTRRPGASPAAPFAAFLFAFLALAHVASAQFEIKGTLGNNLFLGPVPNGPPTDPPVLITQPQFSGVGETAGSAGPIAETGTLLQRYPSARFVTPGTGVETGAGLVLRSARIGNVFAGGVPRYFLGDVITPPATQADGVSEATVAYWRTEPIRPGETFTHPQGPADTAPPVAANANLSYYYSPHAERVFAKQSGRVTVTWVSRVPVAIPGDSQLRYRYREESFSVSSATQRPTRTIYWTERSFNGPAISIPTGSIETVNPVYSTNFPASVTSEYQPVGISINPDASARPPEEKRTLWFQKVGGIGELRAYNLEGRILVEYLGPLKPGSLSSHQFLGADIVEVVRTAPAVNVTVNLGDRLTPRDSSGRLLPLDNSQEYLGSPVLNASPDGQSFYGTHTRADGRQVYYAERENDNPDRVVFYWLERSDAAIHFLGAPAQPNLGIFWPVVKNHYSQLWPGTPAGFHAHYTTPTGGSSPATGVQFGGGLLPQVIFQDDRNQTESVIDTNSQRLVVSLSADGLNRSLLRFASGNEVWYVRVYTQAEGRAGFEEGDSLPALVGTATVGSRLNPPAGYSHAGYIAGGTGYNPVAYRNPFTVGATDAEKGAIIPVNAMPGDSELKVWWFRKIEPPSPAFSPFYVPAKVGRYTVSYPSNPDTIVMASNAGTGDLPPSEVIGSIYVQNDRTKPGFNPNEEHALMLSGRAYALRDDLNNTGTNPAEYTSQPFVLLSYTSPIDQRPAMHAFRVVRELDLPGDANDILFNYPITAGTILQGPMPLPLLPLPLDASGNVKNTEVPGTPDSAHQGPTLYSSFTFKDRKGYHWVYRGPHAGATPTLGMQFYYPMREGFFVPGVASQPAPGTALPYLRPLVSGTPSGDPISGTSLTVIYRPTWPDNAPELRVAETLTLPKFGLPAVLPQASALVLYQQSIANEGATKAAVVLHDPIREKVFALGGAGQLQALPTSIATADYLGKKYFQRLPPHLQSRFYFDPARGTRGSLVFLGRFVDEPAGEDYLHLNVLSPEERAALEGLPSNSDPNAAAWVNAIANLVTRVETFVEDPARIGTYRSNGTPVTVDAQTVAAISDSDTAVVDYALTATGNGTGWVTMLFGNGRAFTPQSDPVAMQIFRVAPQLYTGDLKVLLSSNPLDEQVTLRHSGDFAARPDLYEFEWRYAPPQGGVAPGIYSYALTSRLGSSVKLVQNPAGALPTAAEYAAAGTVTLPRSVQVRDAQHTGGQNRVGAVLRSVDGVDFTAGVPAQIVLSADLADYTGFVLYVNGVAALAFQAPATFSNTVSTSGLVAAGLARQFTVDGNFFQKGINRLEFALYSSADLGAAALVNFRLHASAETDLVAAIGSPWQQPNGTLSNQVVVGGSPTAPLGSPLLVMTDNYFTMRYRPKASANNVAGTGWSRWMQPKLVEGWIKRVLAGVNPFNQRVTDLSNSAVNTDVSVLTQAGTRWEGNVALSITNINDFGLIEIYETLLNRAKNISIDSGYDYGPANDALLLAAGYLNDLYTLLGNEAYADAANPTISVDDSTTVTEVNTSRFSFEGQVSSVLDEELALLRGRDDFLSPSVQVAPAYNRLYWNYTRGINSGEALYAVNYNIREKAGSPTANGVVDAADAQRMFPQGHGDAYGHYLTALKGYYRLLTNPNFTWTPRTEAVSVLGQAVQIDYFDERKFAAAAANLARTSSQVLALTHRKSYRDTPAAGWAHFRDATANTSTGTTRHWGLDEWTARSTQGALFHWVVGNALLPDKDTNPNHTGVQIIDRTTVPALQELATAAAEFQTRIDNANAHLNPIGLSPGAIAFDISPADLKAGKSHYEQVYDRALRAVLNAKGAFDQAAKMTRSLRNQENSLDVTNQNIVDQEKSYVRQLIEIYGTPYTGDIGAGKTYAQGYTGADEVNWFVIDRPTDLVDTTAPVSLTLTVPTAVNTHTGLVMEDLVKNYTAQTTTRTVSLAMNQYAQFSDVWGSGSLGTRRVTGSLQTALTEVEQGRVALQATVARIQTKTQTLLQRHQLYTEMVNTYIAKVAEEDDADADVQLMKIIQTGLFAAANFMADKAQQIKDRAEGLSEAPPKSVGLANDATSALRAAIKEAGGIVGFALKNLATVAENQANGMDARMEKRMADSEGILNEIAFGYQKAQSVYEYELLYKEVIQAHYELAQVATDLQRRVERMRNLIAEGDRIKAEREVFRQRAAGIIQGYRTKDLTFRAFRNEALEQYRSLYDLAARYTYLAAKSYDYETGLLGSTAGLDVINKIVASRALGDLTGGQPQATVSNLGDSGLAGTMARMQADWAVAEPRLGINNPDTNGTLFSLRKELFRLLDDPAITSDDAAWQQTLEQHIMSNVLSDPDVAAQCRNLRKADGSAVPGIVIPFSTSIQEGMNFFGLPLAAGDHTFTKSNFSTKIYSAGMVLRGYIGMDPYVQGNPNATGAPSGTPNALSATPYVYLIPTGTDYMRAPPLGDTDVVRGWDVRDQALPLPFNLGATQFSSTQFFNANGTLSEQPWILRKHQAFRPVNDPVFFYGSVPAEFTSSRLVGRSVWNSGWKIVIPANTLLNNEQDALNRFVASVKDIELFLRTYSHAGN